MTSPNRPLPPPVLEMWNTFVATATNKDPSSTITSQDLRRENNPKTGLHAPAPPISVSDLPSVPIAISNATQQEPIASDFEVLGLLGEGGMGRVLLARQKSLQRDVALKVLKSPELRNDDMRSLLTEAVITGSIEHPSIVPVHALGRDKNGQPVLVMKRIDGVSWRRLFEDPNHPLWSSLGVDTHDRLDAHLEILMSVCNAVHYAHSRGIVHRDIKLDNVMMGGFGEVYLVDWGIAIRYTDVGASTTNDADLEPPVGTLAYMAPEMAMGDTARIDARTDVYLLGATLHFLLTGKPRHTGESTLELLLSARDSEPFVYGSDIPEELAAICNHATHVDREKRFSSALELRKALALFRRHRGSLTIAAKASARLAEMKKVDNIEEIGLQRTMTEIRFAFMQALEAWPGNARAREGLDKVLACMIEYEIDKRQVESARALLDELAVARPDLAKKVDQLALDIEHEKKESLRLHALARDTDLRIDARVQIIIIATLPIGAAWSFIIMAFTESNQELLLRRLILFPIGIIVLLVIAFLAVRKQLETAISRRAVGFLLLFPLTLLVHRLFAIRQGDTVPSMLISDLIFATSIALATALSLRRRVAWLGLIFMAGAFVIPRYPEHASMIFLGFASLSALVLTGMWMALIRSNKQSQKF